MCLSVCLSVMTPPTSTCGSALPPSPRQFLAKYQAGVTKSVTGFPFAFQECTMNKVYWPYTWRKHCMCVLYQTNNVIYGSPLYLYFTRVSDVYLTSTIHRLFWLWTEASWEEPKGAFSLAAHQWCFRKLRIPFHKKLLDSLFVGAWGLEVKNEPNLARKECFLFFFPPRACSSNTCQKLKPWRHAGSTPEPVNLTIIIINLIDLFLSYSSVVHWMLWMTFRTYNLRL